MQKLQQLGLRSARRIDAKFDLSEHAAVGEGAQGVELGHAFGRAECIEPRRQHDAGAFVGLGERAIGSR